MYNLLELNSRLIINAIKNNKLTLTMPWWLKYKKDKKVNLINQTSTL